MTKTMRIKNYIKSIKLYKSDLLLAFGFLFFIPFPVFSWLFMTSSDPGQIPYINIPMIIACFLLTSVSWGAYFYLEAKAERVKNNIFFWLFGLFAILSVVTVLVQPTDSTFFVECKKVNYISESIYPGTQVGDIVTVNTHISGTHKLFFSIGSLLITTIFYIIFFVLPKRMKNLHFLVLICGIVAVFILVLTCYSYISESDKYVPFVKALIAGDKYEIWSSSIKSFLVHRVPYGACLMMGLIFMLLAHQLTHKKFWLIIGAYCYINMIFTWCKTALLISTVMIIFYIIFELIVSFKRHKIRNIIISSIYGLALISVITLLVIAIVSKGTYFGPLYGLYATFSESETLTFRTYIWENIRNELSGGWLVIGRGFGTHNVMLYPMNLVNGDNVCPSHSTYYGILGAGGIINMLGFAGIFAYFVYACIKCFKVNKVKTIGLAFPVLAYFAYSFTECINYLWLAFMFPIILYYNVIKKCEISL